MTFMYHKEHGAKIFGSDELEDLEAGWVDSPAKVDDVVIDKKMTVKELRNECKERGLTGYSRLNEEELIALLKGE